jgi:hypothetical protein
MAIRGLEALDGKLLDGLVFCIRAYELLEQIQAEPGGMEELRLITTKRSKRMVEEILPIATLIQARYGPGLRLKIKWVGGDQPYDAILQSYGSIVEHSGLPRRQYLEVTTAVHAKGYLARQHLNQEGFVFAARGVSRDTKSKATISVPSVYEKHEREMELVDLIHKTIAKKASKDYRKPIALVVRCDIDAPILDDEWENIVTVLRGREGPHRFREVILVEPIRSRCTTLYAAPRGRWPRPPRKSQQQKPSKTTKHLP